jgi:ATP-binding cassette subfamily F protein uup
LGLIGVNGSGKTTLLQVLAGAEQPDEGNVRLHDPMRIEFLPQEPAFDPEATVLEQVFAGNSPEMRLIREYEASLHELQSRPQDEAAQQRMLSLSSRMDAVGAWQLEEEAKKILFRLGIEKLDQKMNTLSGGQRKRVALAGTLIRPCDLLILDEPTNHLDTESIDWLEQTLSRKSSALLMITHDRYFLDRTVSRILELDQGTLYAYEGNYSLFVEKKAEREELQEAAERKRKNLYRNELAWMRRGARARTTKQKARIDRFDQLEASKPGAAQEQLDFDLLSSRLGKQVIELDGVSISYQNHPVLRRFDAIVQRDSRIGIVGPNGAGKSTLLKLIVGAVEPDDGVVRLGQTVRIGYFSQEHEEMDETKRVIEYVREAAETVTTREGMASAAQMLEKFLFPAAVHGTLVGKLSGGEKRRLVLLKLLMQAPNVLMLDEPTNDLDIATLAVLEQYLEEFPGAVIAVSHDRYFLDRTCATVWAFHGDGTVEKHVGNYSEYRQWQLANKRPEASSHPAGPGTTAAPTAPPVQASPQSEPNRKPHKFSYNEQKEFEQIDTVIEAAEKKLGEVQQQIGETGSDYVKLQQLSEEEKSLQAELERLLERWTYLNELAEQIERNKRGE